MQLKICVLFLMLVCSIAQAKTRQHIHKQEAKKQESIKQLNPDIENVIQETEQQYNLPNKILTALIEHESSFNATAISISNRTASYGLGQITLPTAKRFCDLYNRKELLHSNANIKCTAKILRRHINEYGGLSSALTAYRAGSPCKLHSRKLRTCTTGDKKYVKEVLRKLKTIRQRSKMLALDNEDNEDNGNNE